MRRAGGNHATACPYTRRFVSVDRLGVSCRAFITGITGQDGQHLAEFLHGQGYDVFGMVKGQNNPKAAAVVEEMPFVELVPGDLADLPSLVAALEMAQPDEVYNLGAISFVRGVVASRRRS